MLRCPMAARHRIQIPLQATPPAEMLRHPNHLLSAVAGSGGFALRRGRLFPTDRDAGGERVTERPESGGGRNVFALGWRSAFSAAIKFQLRAALAAEVFYAAPPRGNTGHSVYFITASTFQKRRLFQSERMAQLFIEVLLHYRRQGKYLLHEFVLMPDHFHVPITPAITLERALQLIKGSFSFRARKEL